MTTNQNPVSMFLSYAQKDEQLLQELETHLSLLKQQGLISIWDARQIAPGINRARQTEEQLEHASIVILLVSADFLASDSCEGEMKRAVERHEAGQARVIPIIVRRCDWSNAPFAHIQGLPTDARPITTWRDRNEAWTTVTQGIRRAIEDLSLQAPSALYAVGRSVPPQDVLAPKVWNVIRRHNAFFTGRAHVLQQLADGFRVENGIDSPPPQAITAFLATAKTQT